MNKSKIIKSTYFQVIIAIIFGVIFGCFFPELAISCKFLGDGFIKLIKMLIGPLIFCTIFNGVINSGDIKIGKLGLKMLIYFELLTTFALIIGFGVAHFADLGKSINGQIAKEMVEKMPAKPLEIAHNSQHIGHNFSDFLIKTIPDTLSSAFVNGEILSILLVALFLGLASLPIKKEIGSIINFFEEFSKILFKTIGVIAKLAPIGAFGAISYTIGKYGLSSLKELISLILIFYLTCGIFIFTVLALVCRICGFSIIKFLSYIKSEIILVLGTSSSESALPMIIQKLEKLGCSKSAIGIIIPAGYSFNLDGTCIYFTMAIIFIGNAMGADLSIAQQLSLIGLLLITSKGAAGVSGSGFITLASTLAIFNHQELIIGLPLILGVDRFMSEARSITNLIGNSVATIAISKWHNQIDNKQFKIELEKGSKII